MGIIDRTIATIQSQLDEGSQADENIAAALLAHTNAADPHAQYQTSGEVTEAVSIVIASHNSASDPHPQYQIASEIETAINAAVGLLNKSSIGLPNVDNTADIDKPVSTATAAAIADIKSQTINITESRNSQASDDGNYLVNATGSNYTYMLVSGMGENFGVVLIQQSTGTITIAAGSGVTFVGDSFATSEIGNIIYVIWLTGETYLVKIVSGVGFSILAPTTYSGLASLTPSAYTGQSVLVTDVGVNGSVFTSNGTKWVPPTKIQVINGGAGWIVPSLTAANAATYSQTGTTLTVTSTGHNIPATENGGFVYLAIASGLATAGWFSNFTWVSANSFTCTNLESLSTSGEVNTNTAETTITPLTKLLNGGLIGVNGALTLDICGANTSSANLKTRKVKLSGSVVNSNAISNSNQIRLVSLVRNRNNLSKQFSTGYIQLNFVSSSVYLEATVDTSSDCNLTFTVQMAAASEYASIKSIYVELAANDN